MSDKKQETIACMKIGQPCKGLNEHYVRVDVDKSIKQAINYNPLQHCFVLRMSDMKVLTVSPWSLATPVNTIPIPDFSQVKEVTKEAVPVEKAEQSPVVRYVVANYSSPTSIHFTLIQDGNKATCFLNLDGDNNFKTAFYPSRKVARLYVSRKASVWKVLVNPKTNKIVEWVKKNP
jgi:hypothetical protein